MSDDITLTRSEAMAILLLLKSITYEGLNSEEAVSFQATLVNLGERIDMSLPNSFEEQHTMWGRFGKPAWENVRAGAEQASRIKNRWRNQ